MQYPEVTAEEVRRIASAFWSEGCNCSEAMVRTYHRLGMLEGADPETVFALSRGFGNGLGRRLGCPQITSSYGLTKQLIYLGFDDRALAGVDHFYFQWIYIHSYNLMSFFS